MCHSSQGCTAQGRGVRVKQLRRQETPTPCFSVSVEPSRRLRKKFPAMDTAILYRPNPSSILARIVMGPRVTRRSPAAYNEKARICSKKVNATQDSFAGHDSMSAFPGIRSALGKQPDVSLHGKEGIINDAIIRGDWSPVAEHQSWRSVVDQVVLSRLGVEDVEVPVTRIRSSPE